MAEWMRRMVLRRLRPGLLAAGAVLIGLSCGGEDVTAPTTGSLEITTATSGPEPDADGYTLIIDDGPDTPLGTNATLIRGDLDAGDHRVHLTGWAANCSVEAENPRSVTVEAAATANVSFTITCSATTGSLDVSTATTGQSLGPDGYALSVDGGEQLAIGGIGTTRVGGLAPGDHSVGLSGIAANCSVEGENPRTITVVAGQATPVTFAVSCVTPPPTTGVLIITTVTTGPRPDADGYAVRVDGGASQSSEVNATLTVGQLFPGPHSIELSGLADNCNVDGQNPRSFTAVRGADAQVRFSVLCRALPAGRGTWRDVSPIPTIRGQGAAAAVLRSPSGQDLFYVIGGRNDNNPALQRVEAYNVGTDKWTRTAVLPAKRAGASADVVDGKIYVIGGFDITRNPTKTLYVYDPASDTWTEKASLPIQSVGAITGVIGSRLYVVTLPGVFDEQQQLYRYDPPTNAWTRLADPTHSHGGGIGGVINGQFYIAWGSSITVDAYDPATDRWTTRLSQDYLGPGTTCEEGLMFCTVSGAASAVLHDQLYAIGGSNDDNEESAVLAYDPIANTWINKTFMRYARDGAVAGKVRNPAGRPQIVVAGGFSLQSEGDVSQTEVYAP